LTRPIRLRVPQKYLLDISHIQINPKREISAIELRLSMLKYIEISVGYAIIW